MAEVGPVASMSPMFPAPSNPTNPPESSRWQTLTWEESCSCGAPLRAPGAPCAPSPCPPPLCPALSAAMGLAALRQILGIDS